MILGALVPPTKKMCGRFGIGLAFAFAFLVFVVVLLVFAVLAFLAFVSAFALLVAFAFLAFPFAQHGEIHVHNITNKRPTLVVLNNNRTASSSLRVALQEV